jgi:hypothetical protein
VLRRARHRRRARKLFADAHAVEPAQHHHHQEHKIYNRAVAEQMRDLLRSNNIRAEEMTPEQARSFAKIIQESRDPRIRNYNLNILRREILYYFRARAAQIGLKRADR